MTDYARIIITGASSGLGAAYARALSSTTREMVLIARRKERLEQLAAELISQKPDLTALVMPCDLSNVAERSALCRALAELPARRCLLVNNAGLGDYGELLTAQAEKIGQLMQVNMLAPVELTHALLPSMTQSGGDIINIASLAADVFLPDFALYAAGKSFVASFSEAMTIELRQRGIRVLAVCPGPVHTEFGSVAQRAGHDRGDIPFKRFFYTSIPTVVHGSLRALAKGKSRYYPSVKVWIAGCILRFMPLWLIRLILRARPRRVTPQPPPAA